MKLSATSGQEVIQQGVRWAMSAWNMDINQVSELLKEEGKACCIGCLEIVAPDTLNGDDFCGTCVGNIGCEECG